MSEIPKPSIDTLLRDLADAANMREVAAVAAYKAEQALAAQRRRYADAEWALKYRAKELAEGSPAEVDRG